MWVRSTAQVVKPPARTDGAALHVTINILPPFLNIGPRTQSDTGASVFCHVRYSPQAPGSGSVNGPLDPGLVSNFAQPVVAKQHSLRWQSFRLLFGPSQH
jgi:hypothetical protein